MAEAGPGARGNRIRVGLLLLLAALGGLAGGFWLLRDLVAPAPAAAAGAIDLHIIRDDIYAVTRADLRRLGWSEVDPHALRLEHRGEPHPFYLFEDGQDFRLVFYGQAPGEPDRRYTPINVYRLYRDGGAGSAAQAMPPAAAPAGAGPPVDRVTVTQRIEENALYIPAAEAGRPWFWQQLAAPGRIEIVFDLDRYAGGEGALTIALFASTQSEEIDPDHHLVIALNGTEIDDEVFDGSGGRSIEVVVPDGVLQETGNRLEIQAPGDTGVAADIVLLDWVQVDFPRAADLAGGPVHFTAPGGTVAFSGPAGEGLVVFPVGSAEAAAAAGPGDPGGWIAVDLVQGERYAAGALSDLPGPAAFRPVAETGDLLSGPGARYLAIGAPELLEPLAPLLEARAAGGLSVLAVPLQAVYDQFGAGMQTPEAIRSFIRAAARAWDIRPEYVLLVGDWTYDPHGYISEVPEHPLPSFFVFTEYGGETISDTGFARLDDDLLPDLALGRLPARTAAQVEIFVRKTLDYEGEPAGEWSRRVLAVSDGTEARFEQDAAEFLAGFGSGYEPILLSQAGDGSGTAGGIAAELGEGVLVFSYFGHGSLTQLGKDRLFTAQDAASLSNGPRAPVIVNITCLAGLFTHPAIESLSEAMLWNPAGGAVAALGASSLTLPEHQSFLSQGFAAQLAAGERQLGAVLLAAQRAMPADLDPGIREVLETFLLFGDPALLLPANNEPIPASQ